jgi:hypothetical protein
MVPLEKDRHAYQLAWTFMRSLQLPGIDDVLLTRYLRPDAKTQRIDSVSGLYYRLLFHAQNASMKSKVIGGSIGGVERLGAVLFEFNPHAVLERYDTWDQVLRAVEEVLRPRGEVRKTTRSLWPLYCQSILSSAKFIAQFPTSQDFYTWAQFFDEDSRARPALPLLIEREIAGFGFALACDFLKELGYHNFSKPDTHIKDIFQSLGLAESRDDFEVFRAVSRLAASVNEVPYCVDKLFWLIGSGNFYDDPQVGDNGRIGNNKAKFIELAAPQLASLERGKIS